MNDTELSALKEQIKDYVDLADERMLKALHALLEADIRNDWWEELPEQQMRSIEEGIRDAKVGRGAKHEEISRKYLP